MIPQLNIKIVQSPTTGCFYATCEECKGFLIQENSFEKLFDEIPKVLSLLLESGAKIPFFDTKVPENNS